MKTYLEVLDTLNSADEDLIFLNFDEVSVCYDLASDYTYETKGSKDITCLSHAHSKSRATITLAVASNGDVLPPMVTSVYKHAAKGTRDTPKRYERFKKLADPYLLRFTETGFNKDETVVVH